MNNPPVFKTELGTIALVPEIKPRHEQPASEIQRYSAEFPITDEHLDILRALASQTTGIQAVELSNRKDSSFRIVFEPGYKPDSCGQIGHDFVSRFRRWINTGSLKTIEQVMREADHAMAVHSTVDRFDNHR